jgi:single-strand DNA-binding protein
MSYSINRVELMGHLGADPEIRRTQDGRPIANMRLATSKHWRDKQTGERKEKSNWHTVVVFNEGLCKIVEQYFKKGMRVRVVGELQTRKWTAQDGADRYSTEVIVNSYEHSADMVDPRGDRPPLHDGAGIDDGRTAGAARVPPRGSGSISSGRPGSSDLDDDIPF